MKAIETMRDLMTRGISRFYAMGNYGKVLAMSVEEVSRDTLSMYFEEEFPDFLEEELRKINAEEAKKIVVQVNATAERILAGRGMAEFPFWEESGDKDAHWYTMYEGGLEILFDFNAPKWYKVYSAIYEFAEVANIIRNGESLTDGQIAYWVLATVPKEHRMEFVRAKIAEARYKIALAEKQGQKDKSDFTMMRIGLLEETMDFWAIIENLLTPDE